MIETLFTIFKIVVGILAVIGGTVVGFLIYYIFIHKSPEDNS